MNKTIKQTEPAEPGLSPSRAEQSLRNSELRYRRLFETAQDGILILDAKTGAITDVNPYLINLLGYSRAEFIEKKLWQVGAFKDVQASKDAFEALQKNEHIRYEDLPLKAKDGRLIQVEFVSNVYQVGAEQVIQCNIRDITTHKHTVEALRLMSDTQREIAYINNLTDIFDLVGKKIQELTGGYVAVSTIDRQIQAVKVYKVYGFEKIYETVIRTFGIDPAKSVYYLKDMGEDQIRQFTSGRLERYEHGLFDILSHKIPKPLCEIIERQFGITAIYTMGFAWEETAFGGIIIFSKRDLTLYREMIETIMNQAAVGIKRITAEEALRTGEERYRILVEQASDGIFVTDSSGKFVDVNARGCAMLGHSREEILSKRLMDLFPPEELAADPIKFEEVRAGKTVVTERHWICKDGSLLPVEISARMLPDGRLQGIIRDITERKQAASTVHEAFTRLQSELRAREEAEEALQESEKRFRALIENAPDGIALLGVDGKIAYASPSTQRILGLTSEEVVGSNPSDYTHPDDLEPFLTLLADLMQKPGGSFTTQYRFRHKDGSWRWLESTVSNLLTEPSVRAVVFNYRDITERKRAEEKLAASDAELRALFASMHDAVLVIDREGVYRKIAHTNPELRHLSPQELLGKRLQDVFPAEQSEVFYGVVQQVLETKQTKQIEYELTFGSQSVWYDASISPMSADSTLWVARDITERKQAEQAQVHREAELKESQRIARIGSWQWTIATGVIAWSDGLNHLLVRDLDLPAPTFETLSQFYTPESWQQLGVVIARAVETGAPYDIEVAMIRADGTTCLTTTRGEAIRGADGTVVKLRGTVLDITERKRGEETLRQSQEETTHANRLLLALSQAAQAVQRARTTEEVYSAIQDQVNQMGYSASGFELSEDGRSLRIAYLSYGADLVRKAEKMIGLSPRNFLFRPRVDSVYQKVIDKGETVFVKNAAQAVADTLPKNLGILARPMADLFKLGQSIFTPLRVGDETIGLMAFTGPGLTEADNPAVTAFARQATIAIQNARLYEQAQQEIAERKRAEETLRQRLTELEAIHTVSTALRNTSTRDEALPILLEKTLAALETDAGIIWLYHAGNDELRVAVTRGWFRQFSEMSIKPGAGIAGKVFATGQAHITTDFAHDPVVLQAITGQFPAGWGGICLPIRTGAIIVGTLTVSLPPPRQITPEQVKLLESLTGMAGTTLHRMSLNEETVRQLDRLEALHSIDIAISASMNLQMTLNVLLEHVKTQLNADATSVLLLNPHSQTLEYAAGRGFRTRSAQTAHIRLGEDFAGRAALERRTIQADDPAQIQKTTHLAALWAGEGFAAYYGVPLIAKGEVKGVLEIFHRTPLQPDSEWLNFLETLAGQAAIAIDSAQLFENLQRSNADLALAYDATIEGWSRALDLRDEETEGHTQRVTEITLRLAEAMGIGDAELVHIRRGALLHDIGKMGVPDSILLKPGKLTDEEWGAMRLHPQLAYDMLSPIAYLKPALDIPYCHHEKWDGTGYPRGLKGEQIPLAARLFAIVDVWDALTSDRVYRPAWSREKVIEHIKAGSGSHFDPKVVEAFFRMET